MFYGTNKIRIFSEIDFRTFEQQKINELTDAIEKKGKDYILRVDEDEFKEYIYRIYYIEPVTVDLINESIDEPIVKSETVTEQIFGGRYQVDVYYISVNIPFQGNPIVFKLRPTTYYLKSEDVYIGSSSVSFEISLRERKPEEFNRKKEEMKRNAFNNLTNANNDIILYNNKLKNVIKTIFGNYKNKCLSENDFFSAIKANINKDTESVFTIPTIKRKIIPQPLISSNKEFSSEPMMSVEMYLDVLKVIYDSGKNMEKKPALYIGKDEEGLRDQFLFVLETRYEGITATGETFNRSGKTDILLKYAKDGSNLFVGECKIWHGSTEFMKAISQLFDKYLTWRDSKVALLFFVTNNDFSNVLKIVKSDISKHPYYLKDNGTKGESSFSYIFHLPQDKDKKVSLEILLFHYDKK